jgi:hypothetical protein
MSFLPVKLYPWDSSKLTFSPGHGDACRCVKPNQQEERKNHSLGASLGETEKQPLRGNQVSLEFREYSFYIFLRAGCR